MKLRIEGDDAPAASIAIDHDSLHLRISGEAIIIMDEDGLWLVSDATAALEAAGIPHDEAGRIRLANAPPPITPEQVAVVEAARDCAQRYNCEESRRALMQAVHELEATT